MKVRCEPCDASSSVIRKDQISTIPRGVKPIWFILPKSYVVLLHVNSIVEECPSGTSRKLNDCGLSFWTALGQLFPLCSPLERVLRMSASSARMAQIKHNRYTVSLIGSSPKIACSQTKIAMILPFHTHHGSCYCCAPAGKGCILC